LFSAEELHPKYTFKSPALEEILIILGEVDSWRRGIRASVILFTP